MECAAGVGGQTDDVARVGGDFGFDKDDMKHGVASERSFAPGKRE